MSIEVVRPAALVERLQIIVIISHVF